MKKKKKIRIGRKKQERRKGFYGKKEKVCAFVSCRIFSMLSDSFNDFGNDINELLINQLHLLFRTACLFSPSVQLSVLCRGEHAEHLILVNIISTRFPMQMVLRENFRHIIQSLDVFTVVERDKNRT